MTAPGPTPPAGNDLANRFINIPVIQDKIAFLSSLDPGAKAALLAWFDAFPSQAGTDKDTKTIIGWFAERGDRYLG